MMISRDTGYADAISSQLVKNFGKVSKMIYENVIRHLLFGSSLLG